jgi:hypothetical protein
MPPKVCPNCGAVIPPRAKACPECGSDESTGWAESAYASHLGIPDEQFDYDDFVKAEFGSASPRPRGIRWFWWVTALVLAGALLFCWFRF